MNTKVICSFVHGYKDLEINLLDDDKPALWLHEQDKSAVFSYPFPRNPEDFFLHKDKILGELPLNNAKLFKKLPRFGFTGLAQTQNYIFAGSWNAVYKIDKDSYQLNKIISNRLMSDLHGIYVDDDVIISILTAKDIIVFTNHDGEIIDFFSISNDLSIERDVTILDIDWRFISKQFRGSMGLWHFNFVQKIGDELWLTSRNISAFIVVNLVTNKVFIRSISLLTTSLLHDGVKQSNKYYFTSVDGKIIIAAKHGTPNISWVEDPGNMDLYTRDLVARIIRLENTELGREPNWCRGIEVIGSTIYVTIDGRYDTDLSFGLLAINEDTENILSNHRLNWKDIGDENNIRYVTGFDVLALSSSS